MTKWPSTRLIILSSASLHREAWRALLSGQPAILIVDTVADAFEVVPLLQPDQPTTVLVDVLSPQPDLAQQLRTLAPEAGLLFLIQSYELSEVLVLLRAGATGCISRDASLGDLARAIIAVGRGEIALPPHMAGRALAALARGEPVSDDGLIEPLSEREVEVLRLLAQGMTNKDIAQTLILSVRTIEAHLRNIYGKLGVRSRTEAALWAVEHGYGADE
jgi:DNA-binding NarL/FixJ family response regulator